MSKILNNISKLKDLYLDNEKEFLYCPNAINYCPLPIFGIERQTYNDGECSISLFIGDERDFKSIEEFWGCTILSGYIHEGCNWDEIISDIASSPELFIGIDSEKFFKHYNGYTALTSGYDYRIESIPEVKDSILITDDIGDCLCVCSTNNNYYAFHYLSSG
jgi:hypothetical protein